MRSMRKKSSSKILVGVIALITVLMSSKVTAAAPTTKPIKTMAITAVVDSVHNDEVTLFVDGNKATISLNLSFPSNKEERQISKSVLRSLLIPGEEVTVIPGEIGTGEIYIGDENIADIMKKQGYAK